MINKISKQIVILEHGNGRLGNQLWNHVSVLAYCLENGYRFKNHSFFDYYLAFKSPKPNLLVWLISHESIRKNPIYTLVRPYRRYINLVKKFFSKQVVYSGDLRQFYLPPNQPNRDEAELGKIKGFEKDSGRTLYFCGWMFRNPIGIKKHRLEITSSIIPNKKISREVDGFIGKIRQKYRHLIGVHIRQGDYVNNFMNGKYYFPPEKVPSILHEYLNFSGIPREKVCFIICSDGPIDRFNFTGLNIELGLGEAVRDLFILSKTDLIIGSDSTFGAFASYQGNKPFIVLCKSGSIDWEYYRNQKEFFENKYSTLVFY